VDVNAVVQRVDIDAIVEETELGTIVAKSTTGFATEAVDAARSRTAEADRLVDRVVGRVLRRRETRLGPALLIREDEHESDGPGDDAPPPREP